MHIEPYGKFERGIVPSIAVTVVVVGEVKGVSSPAGCGVKLISKMPISHVCCMMDGSFIFES